MRAVLLAAAMINLYHITAAAALAAIPGAISAGSFFSDILIFGIISTSITGIGCLSYYFKNRDLQKFFFQLKDYQEFRTDYIKILLPFFIISCLLLFLPALLLFKSIVLKIIVPFSMSIIIIVILHFIFQAVNFYNREKRKFILQSFIAFSQTNLKNIRERKIIIPNIKLLTYLFPVLIFFIAFRTVSIINSSIKIQIFQAFSFSLLFTYPLVKKFFFHARNTFRPFIFTAFVFFILTIISFFNSIDIFLVYKTETLLYVFKDFITPLVLMLNRYGKIINSIFDSIPLIPVAFTPVIFMLFFLFNYFIYNIFLKLEVLMDERIKKTLHKDASMLIFGDSLSIYPFIFSLIVYTLILILLKIELPVLSSMIYNLVITLQVAEIFKFDFLTADFFDIIFNSLYYLTFTYFLLRLLIQFISSLLSHFILFNNEIVYLSDNIFIKTTLRIPVSRINYVIFKQNIIEKLLDIGTIFIETSDKNGLIKIKGITGIKEKNILIMDKIKVGL